MVDNEQPKRHELNRRKFLTSSAAGAGTGLFVFGTAQQAKGEVVNGPDRGRITRNWQLKYHENFAKPLPGDKGPWIWDKSGEDSPWDEGYMDENGKFWQIKGGEAFRKALNSFRIYRKRFEFGQDGWLTAELEARDRDKDGFPEEPPSLTSEILENGGQVGKLSVPSHEDGLVIRNTKPLPSQYRIEYTLKTINFGGQRNGKWNYNGLINGYSPEGCKTLYPWHPNADFEAPYCDWINVREGPRAANGFYFLAIMDFPAAPHNNFFMHRHRKVAMDAFNHRRKGVGHMCNPATGKFYPYSESTGNGVNCLFLGNLQPNGWGTNQLFASECTDGKAIDPLNGPGRGAISAVELKPEMMPKEEYRFAIERTGSGYTLEISGNFRFVGEQTYRYHRDFIPEDGEPIWHYNQSPDEYEGQFDGSRTMKGPYGSFTAEHIWPEGSSYPDYFMIGEPHINWYEGDATIDDVRLYVPK